MESMVSSLWTIVYSFKVVQQENGTKLPSESFKVKAPWQTLSTAATTHFAAEADGNRKDPAGDQLVARLDSFRAAWLGHKIQTFRKVQCTFIPLPAGFFDPSS